MSAHRIGDPVEMAAQRVRDARYLAARMGVSEEDIRKRADDQTD